MAAKLSDDPNPSRLYFRKMYKTYYKDWYQMAPYNNKSIEFRVFLKNSIKMKISKIVFFKKKSRIQLGSKHYRFNYFSYYLSYLPI
jgi:hypothetical protein